MNTDPERIERVGTEPGPRWQIGIGRGLMLAFGGLVFLAVAIVLGLGVWSARENTISLTRRLAEFTLLEMENGLSAYLSPARAAVDHLGARIDGGSLDVSDGAAMRQALASALAPAPQITGIVFVRPDGRAHRVRRNDTGVEAEDFDIFVEPEARAGLREAMERRGSYWGKPVQPVGFPLTLINVRRPVVVEGRFAGALIASVRAAELSELVSRQGRGIGGQAFVLYDKSFVLAHPRLRNGYDRATPDRPLPGIVELGDPVLSAYSRQTGKRERGEIMAQRMGVEIIQTADGKSWPTLSKSITGFGDVPWTIGVYFRNDDVNKELRRLAIAGSAGLAVLVLAVVMAWQLSRYLARPLNALAVAARQVRDFELEGVASLPRSRVREIDAAGSAVNAMVGSLRWFELYVPRSLVQRLIRQGDAGVRDSAQRTATVMFTDVVGFTTLSENMGAEETAALLNEHFRLLGACVEAELGTIDKFMGDGLMAFWGAPEALPDHAERACRAALAMRSAVDADNARRRESGLAELRVRIGLHAGNVIVGNIGAPGRVNYTIVGDTVNAASRLEQLGREHMSSQSGVTILLSSEVRAHAPSAASALPLGSRHLSGRRKDVEVFAL